MVAVRINIITNNIHGTRRVRARTAAVAEVVVAGGTPPARRAPGARLRSTLVRRARRTTGHRATHVTAAQRRSGTRRSCSCACALVNVTAAAATAVTMVVGSRVHKLQREHLLVDLLIAAAPVVFE